MAMSCCVDQVNALEDKIYTVFFVLFFSSIFLHFSSCWSFYLVLLVIIFTPTRGILPHIAPEIDFSEFEMEYLQSMLHLGWQECSTLITLESTLLPLSHVFHCEVSSDLMSAH